jgi:hypothetical protein
VAARACVWVGWSGLVVVQVVITVAGPPLAGWVAWNAMGLGMSRPTFVADDYKGMSLVASTPVAPGSAEVVAREAPVRIAEIVRRLETLPGVTGVHLSDRPPTHVTGEGITGLSRLELDGIGSDDDAAVHAAVAMAVGPGFFGFPGVPGLDGRPCHRPRARAAAIARDGHAACGCRRGPDDPSRLDHAADRATRPDPQANDGHRPGDRRRAVEPAVPVRRRRVLADLFNVTRRRREIGIRSALGARPGRVLLGVMAHSIRQLAWGVGGGALLVALVPPLSLTGSWFVGIHGLLVVVAVVLVGMGSVAAWGRRALEAGQRPADSGAR